MTLGDLGVAIMLFLVTATCVLASWFLLQRPLRRSDLRLPLFGIRDTLVWLVAEGKIQEDDEVFQFLYRSLNDIIPIVKPMRFRAIVGGFKRIELTKEDEAAFQLFLRSVDHGDVAVRQVARDLFMAIFHILMRDVLVGLAFHGSFRGIARTFVGRRPLIFRDQQDAYRMARRMETATAHLTLSPA